jgi:hypothetical protein
VTIVLAGAVALLGCSEPESSLTVWSHGIAPSVGDVESSLELQVGGRSYRLSGGSSGTDIDPEEIARLEVGEGDSVTAVAIVRTTLDAELARARIGFRAEADYDYNVSFQICGMNPDQHGFCHASPERTPLLGLAGDTLFLWRSGLPRGAVC